MRRLKEVRIQQTIRIQTIERLLWSLRWNLYPLHPTQHVLSAIFSIFVKLELVGQSMVQRRGTDILGCQNVL